MISIPLLVCLIGFVVWILLSRPTEKSPWYKPVLAKASEWLFVLGGFWTLYAYAGKVAF